MKILLLSKYPRRGASSRQRFYQYLPALAAHGHEVSVRPLFDEEHLARLYGDGGARPGAVAASYLERVGGFLEVARADLVWLEGELWPFLPALAERALAALRVPLVVDYDDAVFHKYDRHRSAIVRRLFAKKIDAVMAHARLVLAGNAYIAARARAAGARWVEIVPTVVDLDHYPSFPRRDDVFRVGWVGTPGTVAYLDPLTAPLRELVNERGAEIVLVGVDESALGASAVHLPWREDTEAEALSRFDVGIMPLPDTPWERGKCGYKLIQYMAAGRATVASPVGVNREIVVPGVTGFWAQTTAEWRDALFRLEADRGLTRALGEAGRAAVEERWSLKRWAPRLVALLEAARRP